MFDPISLATGAGILAVGFLTGRLGRRKPANGQPKAAICECSHSLANHDPQDNACRGEIKRGNSFDGNVHYVPCTCRQYVGPKPIEDLFAPQYLPPAE